MQCANVRFPANSCHNWHYCQILIILVSDWKCTHTSTIAITNILIVHNHFTKLAMTAIRRTVNVQATVVCSFSRRNQKSVYRVYEMWSGISGHARCPTDCNVVDRKSTRKTCCRFSSCLLVILASLKDDEIVWSCDDGLTSYHAPTFIRQGCTRLPRWRLPQMKCGGGGNECGARAE